MNPPNTGYDYAGSYDTSGEATGQDSYAYQDQYSNWQGYYQGNNYSNQTAESYWKPEKSANQNPNYVQYPNYSQKNTYSTQRQAASSQDTRFQNSNVNNESAFPKQTGYNRGRGWGSGGNRRGQNYRTSYQKSFISGSDDNAGTPQKNVTESWVTEKDSNSDVCSHEQLTHGADNNLIEKEVSANPEEDVGDVAVGENGNSEEQIKSPFRFNRRGGGIRKKRSPYHKHTTVKRFVAPKNALMSLMEAQTGLNFVEESVTVEAQGNVFSMSVEVNGVKYSGTGLSKDLAKHAAAEAALAGFVKNPGPSDFTPWSSIASFAMYKLFNEWNCSQTRTGPQIVPYSPVLPSTEDAEAGAVKQEVTAEGNVKMEDTPDILRKPAKTLPEAANTMNPVMLLHQMRPVISYNTSQEVDQNKYIFTLTTSLDDQTFTGTGPSMKKAKYELAKQAVKILFNIDSQWIPA